jgi:hypothetical protein
VASATVRLHSVRIVGTARGASFAESEVSWVDGGVRNVSDLGVLLYGGRTRLERVHVEQIVGGSSLFEFAVAATDGAEIEASELVVAGSDGIGLLLDGARAWLRGATVTDIASPGIWVQQSGRLELEAGEIHRTRMAGVVGLMPEAARITDTRIRDVAPGTVISSGRVHEVGDGLHMRLADTEPLRVRGVRVERAERAGLLIEVESGRLDPGSFSDVVVASSGDSYGAVAQSPRRIIEPDLWDEGIERRGTAERNDVRLREPLPTLGAPRGP